MEYTLKRKKELLVVLQQDIEIFGPAGDDLARVEKLKNEIAELEGQV